MDPVTTAILAAITAGIAPGLTEVSKKAILDAYDGLKALIRRKFGDKSELAKVVDGLEQSPESKGRKESLQEEVEKANGEKDPEILAAAQALLEEIKAQPGGEQHIQTAIGSYIAQADRGGTAVVVGPSQSTVFDQRGQQVQYQYNAAGDINFGAVQNRLEAAAEIGKLQEELSRANQAGAIDDDAATDAEYQIKKALQQAQKPEGDKNIILNHLRTAKEIIAGVAGNVAAATGLVTGLGQAIEMVRNLF